MNYKNYFGIAGIMIIFLTLISFIPFNFTESQTEFNDSTTSKNISGMGSWEDIIYVKLPKYSDISTATINLTGFQEVSNTITYSQYNGSSINDTFSDSANPTDDNSGESSIFVGTNPVGTDWRSFMKFNADISSYQDYIKSANITVYISSAYQTTGSLRIYNITQDWNQNTLNHNNQPSIGSQFDAVSVTAFSTGYKTLELTPSEIKSQINNGRGFAFDSGDSSGEGGTLRSSEYSTNPEQSPQLKIFYNATVYPMNVTLDIGNDGDNEFFLEEELTQNQTSDLSSEIKEYLSSCSADEDGFCDVPINVSGIDGKLQLSELNIQYSEVPRISIVAPGNNTNHTSISINYTVDDTNLDSCWFTTNTGSTNTTITCGENITTGISDGLNILFTIYANDTDGNENSSSLTFTLDRTAPSITIINPEASQEFTYNESINLNFSVVDAVIGTDSCWYNLDNGNNISLANCQNTTFNTSDGAHTINFFANDSLGNEGSQSRSFTISLDAPAINLDSPANGTYWNNGANFHLNYTAADPNGISYCEMWHNINGTFSLNETNTGVSSGNQNFSSYNITDGNYLWNVFCEDTTTSGRFSTNNHTFTIDETFPTINITNIQTTQGSQTISFNHSINETNPNSCKYSIYNSNGTIDGLNNNLSVICGANETTATVSSYGTYTLRIYALDLADNEAYTDQNFTTSPTEGGGSTSGGGSTIVKQIVTSSVKAQNFSVQTTTQGSTLDIVLAKDSVRPRTKTLVILNKGRDPLNIELICESLDSYLNKTTNETEILGEDICDYVVFDKKNITVTPNEDTPTTLQFSVYTPDDSKFGDQYSFNIIAQRKVIDENEETTQFSKLSVTSRVTYWGLLFKYSYFPLQQAPDENKSSYPILMPGIFFGFLAFTIMIFLTKKRIPLTGFFLSVIAFVLVFLVSIYYL